ncbi:MAG: HAD-IIA family hydrolase [Actinomycetota bacterium]
MRLGDAFDAFLIDLDGVVWRGEEHVDGASETITSLREANKRVVFVTNNASRSPKDYAAKLMKMLIPTPPSDVVTSAHAVIEHLHEIGLIRGELVHVLGTDALVKLIGVGGFETTREVDGGVAALVVAWNPQLTFDDLRKAADVARLGVPFVGANRDATYPSESGLLPGSGSILAAVETASGRVATVVGKPAPALFRMALERAGSPAERTLFVGDRSDSDVAGARAAGIPVALVLTGVTSKDDIPVLTHTPDHVLDSIADLLREGAVASSVVVVRDEPPVASVAPAPRIAPSTERDDEDEPGDEPTDVREERDTTAWPGAAETREPAQELDDEPQSEGDRGWESYGEEEEAERHQGDDSGAWPQDDVSAEDPGDGAGGPDNGDAGVRTDQDVGVGGHDAGRDVEDREAHTPQSIFDVVPEHPEEQHVERDVQDVPVHEH